jgi:transposase, IS5 family
VLAGKIDWQRFHHAFTECYSAEIGAPAIAVRVMVGLHYLKHAFNESDESLLARWVENPYWQAFCGFDTMQHEPPVHSTSLVKWRQRVGAEKLALLLKETIEQAVAEKNITTHELQQVIVDTTVQEKNITYPTDSKLYLKAITKLAAAAKHRQVTLRQTYLRVSKRMAAQVGRYAHAKQFKRMRQGLKKMRTWLGRIIRDFSRKLPVPDVRLGMLLKLCQRLHAQQPTDQHKLYSLHEPEVECISKGKARQRYEFGQKVSIATTNRGSWIVGAQLCSGNPYDGHTLEAAMKSIEANTGVAVTQAYVDKGYRGHNYQGSAIIYIAGSSNRGLTRTMIQRKRRRSAVEPKIGHLKRENRLGRCFLSGLVGDAINVVLAAAGSNLRKLLAALAAAPFGRLLWLVMVLIAAIWSLLTAQTSRPSPAA